METNVQEQRKLWERLPGEPEKWWVRFEKYRLMGPNRSMQVLNNNERKEIGKGPLTALPGGFREAVMRYRWTERVEAWDESLLVEMREEWAKRREKWRQDEWDLANAMHKKVLDMMVFPVARIVREADGKTTIIEPADWKLGDIPKMVDVISKLARLSSGLATERTESVDWNPNDCTEEELMQIAETGDVRGVLASRKSRKSSASIEIEAPRTELAAGPPV